MILVSFFSEDDALSDEIKMCYIFNMKVTKIMRSAFFGTPGIEFFVLFTEILELCTNQIWSKNSHETFLLSVYLEDSPRQI